MAFKNYPEDPTLYKMRNGTSDPFLKIDQTDQVRNQIILLHEVPDKFQGITISDGNKNYSVKDSGLPDPSTIVIDWIQGKLTTHSSLEGKTLTCSYYGKGNVYFPSSKVYVDTDKTTGEVKETLKNLTDDMMENRDIAAETNRVVQAAENIREQNETTRQSQEQVRQERINNTRFVSPYNSNTTYQLNNMVSFNGHSFIAKKQTKGNPPPTDVTVVTENEYWALMSRKGTDGTGTVHVHRDKFVATEGQRTFTLSHTYDQFQNRTNVTVGGVPQKTPENYEETTDKIITLSEGVPAGTIIEVKYFSESVPLQSDIQTTVDNHTGTLSTHATKLNNHELELVNVNAQLAHNAKKIKVISEVSIHDYESYIPNKNDDPEEWLWADALDAAFTDLTTNYTGGVVKFGSRIYKFERPVKLYRYQRYTIYGKPSTGYTHGAPLSHIKLEGTNVHETILAMSEGNTTGLFDTRASENEGKYNFAIDISDMALVGNNYQGVSLIISGDTPAYLMNFKQVSFLRFDKGFDHDRALGNDGYAFFYNCYFRNNNNGFRIGGDNNLFSGCIVERNKGYGAIFKKTHGCHFSGGKIQYNATEHDPNLGDEQVYFNDCDAIKFSGTYFEPAHSTIPEENYTRALVRFHGVDGQEVNSVSFDGCYIFANKLSYFARTTGSGRVNSLSVSNSFLQYFKLMSHANLIGLENTSILNDVSFLNNTISYFTDSNDQPTESWRITNINVGERVKPRTPLYSLENATDNSDIYFVNGSVSPDGSQTYFGDSYTVAKVETGKYKITLRRGNNGTRLKNSSIFPAVVTPRLTDNEANANVVKFASIRSISNSEFEVLIHDREGVLIDGAFSFMVFATFRK